LRIAENHLLIAVGVLEDASRTGEALKGLAVALGACARGGHGILGFIPAAAALELKYGDATDIASERIVRHKLSLRLESLHAD
jgi:hypothetical protein